MLCAALFSCRWELSKANNLGRRAPGAGAGVLARPHPCQEDKPRSAQVRAQLHHTGERGSPFAPLWKDPSPSPHWDPGDDLGFGSAGYCLPCARLSAFVLPQACKT